MEEKGKKKEKEREFDLVKDELMNRIKREDIRKFRGGEKKRKKRGKEMG